MTLSNRAACLPILLFLAMISPPVAAQEQDWPSWRGSRNDGVSHARNVPVRWSNTDNTAENIAWKTRVPGEGHSSPIIVGDAVLVTTCVIEKKERAVACFDRQSGELRWITPVAVAEIEEMHRQNTPASSTAASVGRLVYATFLADGQYLVVALDLSGAVAWRRWLGAFESHHGFCSVPILHGDTLLLAGMQDSEQSFVARLDTTTGETLWRQPTGTSIRSFSPPFPMDDNASGSIVVSGADCTSGYDLAAGDLLWRLPGPAQKTVSSILLWKERLLVCGGRDNLLLAIDGATQRKPEIAWTTAKGAPYVSSPIVAGDEMHMVSDNGVLTSVDLSTGQTTRQKRMLGPTSASPVLAEGRLYLIDVNGMAVVIQIAPGFRVIAKNRLREPVFASPAVADGEIFLRGAEHLYCVRAEGGA